MEDHIVRAFAKIGAKVVEEEPRRPRTRAWNRFLIESVPNAVIPIRFDLRDNSRKGATVVITKDKKDDTEIVVLDVDPATKHLVLMTKNGTDKHRMLVGFDEREYFVAGIPEDTPITRVADAKNALKPDNVRHAKGATIRQGEWFFVPAPNELINEDVVLHNEPLRRGAGSKPHMCQDLARFGGTTVYTSRSPKFPNPLTQLEMNQLSSKDQKEGSPWATMKRDPKVYVRGWVRHKDHASLDLKGWHEVVMNTEPRSQMGRNISFLD